MERRLSCSKFLENEKWIEVQLEFVEKNISAHNAVGSTSSLFELINNRGGYKQIVNKQAFS